MQVKTTLKFCLIPVRQTFIQKSRTKKDERNTSSCLFPHIQKWSRAFKKLPYRRWHTNNTDHCIYTFFCDAGQTTWLWSREVASFGKPRNCWEGLGKTVSFLDRMWGKRSPYSLFLRMSASKDTMEAGVKFMELLCDPDATLPGIYSWASILVATLSTIARNGLAWVPIVTWVGNENLVMHNSKENCNHEICRRMYRPGKC